MNCEMAGRHICCLHIHKVKQLLCVVGRTQSEIFGFVDVCEAEGALLLGCIDDSVGVQLQVVCSYKLNQ